MMLRDLRTFFKSLRRDWFHWGMAILILGIAVGATATVYALIDSLVLHPLPIPELDRVVTLGGLARDNLPMTDPVEWWKQTHSLEYLAFYSAGAVTVQAGGWRGPASADEVSSEYFRVFGVKAFRGRDFGPEDESPADNRVVILSHAFWKSHFEGQPLPLGSMVQLNRVPYVIIGIAPESLDGLGTDLWLPRCLDPTQSLKLSPDPNMRQYFAWVGRLRRGATIAQTHEELIDLLTRLNTSYTPKTHISYGEVIGVTSLENKLAFTYGPALKALFAGAILILLIAGTDCSAFLMGRAAGRAKEVAIRRVLGASRLDIFRQALVEASGFGLLSGFVGLLAAQAMLFACQSEFPIYLVRLRGRVLIDPQVVVGCLLLGISVGMLAGWLPGKRMVSENTIRILKEDSGLLMSPRGKWLRVSLVVLQVALTFVLVMSATLTLETARNLFGKDKGYSLGDVIAVHLSIEGEKTPRNTNSVPKQKQAQDLTQDEKDQSSTSATSGPTTGTGESQALYAKEAEILDAAASMPAVSDAAFTDQLPIRPPNGGYYVEGLNNNSFLLFRGSVSRSYFQVLQMRFLAGQTFSNSQAHEIVIEQKVAQKLWPGQSAVGRTLVLMRGSEKGEARTVVGVVNDTRSLEIGDDPGGQFYLPLADSEAGGRNGLSAYVLMRCRSACGDLTPALLAALKKVGADSYVDHAAPLADFGGEVAEPLWIRTSLLSFYALMGLALALAGVFLLSSYVSVMRKHETGIRMALGAVRTELIFQIAREGLVAALMGLAVGAALWFSMAQVLRNLLYGVTSLDPITFSIVGSLIFASTALASTLPAFLAVIRENPADLLRVV